MNALIRVVCNIFDCFNATQKVSMRPDSLTVKVDVDWYCCITSKLWIWPLWARPTNYIFVLYYLASYFTGCRWFYLLFMYLKGDAQAKYIIQLILFMRRYRYILIFLLSVVQKKLYFMYTLGWLCLFPCPYTPSINHQKHSERTYWCVKKCKSI